MDRDVGIVTAVNPTEATRVTFRQACPTATWLRHSRDSNSHPHTELGFISEGESPAPSTMAGWLSVCRVRAEPVSFRVEGDFSGPGAWAEVIKRFVGPPKPLENRFPDAFGASWLCLVAEKDSTATATFVYE